MKEYKKVHCQWCRVNLKSNKAKKIGNLMYFCDVCYPKARKELTPNRK